MKKPKHLNKLIIAFVAVVMLTQLTPFGGTKASCQNIGINATGAIPNASAALDIDMPNKGLLIPRIALLSTTDVVTIPTPATSLLVYNTNAAMTGGALGYWYWNGTTWVQALGPQGPTGLTGPTGPQGPVGVNNNTGANISQLTASKGNINWVTCYTTCRNATDGGFTDWRMPTFDEAHWSKRSGLLVPSGDWSWSKTWTATSASCGSCGPWLVMDENTSTIVSTGLTISLQCRYVR